MLLEARRLAPDYGFAATIWIAGPKICKIE